MKTIAVIFCVLALALIAVCELRGDHHENHHDNHHDNHHEKKHGDHHHSSSSSSESDEEHHGGKHSHSHSHSHSSEEHHKKSNRECSVKTSYWVDHIKERRVCRDTATSDTSSCGNCCVSGYLDEHGNKADTTRVIGFLAINPKDGHHRQCVCCSPKRRHRNSGSKSGSGSHENGHCHFTSLKFNELTAYANSYAGRFDNFNVISFGVTTLLHDNHGGVVVECECHNKANNSFCALAFDNGVESFIRLPHTSTAFNQNSNADGSFGIVSSKSITITCGEHGRYIVDGKPLSASVCFSATFNNGTCTFPFRGNNADCTKLK